MAKKKEATKKLEHFCECIPGGRIMQVIGIIITLFGAFAMWQGKLFGKDNLGVTSVIVVIGFGWMAVSSLTRKRK